ncbi:MAG: protein-L-isoaspartate O-methyltransferase [Pseudomonadota bacterium]
MTDFAAARVTMVDSQVRPSDVTLYPIIDAMLTVPREEFVPHALRAVAYAGEHVPLSAGRVVLDPRVFAKMLDMAEIGRGDLVLDIGCGLGYSAAVISLLAEAVVAVEADAEMVREAVATLTAQNYDSALVVEAPLAEGDTTHGPFDVIMIEGGIETLPQAIADQLKDGGRICALFAQGATGRAALGVKTGGRIAWRDVFDATAPVLEGFAKSGGFEF